MSLSLDQLFIPYKPNEELLITPDRAGWTYTGLQVIELESSQSRSWSSEGTEQLVLPLEGSCTVRTEDAQFALHGRADVFSGPTDCLYIPIETPIELTSQEGGTFAIPFSRATERLTVEYLPAATVPVEVRGAGSATRLLNNFFAPERGHAQRLVAVEVITPAGNTSSYPPHKHDEVSVRGEAQLEEIYYFRFQDSRAVGLHSTYTSDGSINAATLVRNGDVFLVPRGYHGPCVALPGYDMYYLNVLAGPGAPRSLGFSDDPAHAWVRDSWKQQPVDPRLAGMLSSSA